MAAGTSFASTTVPSSADEATSSSPTGSSIGLALRLLGVAEDHRSHPLGDAEEAGAGPVEAHVADHHPRAADQHRRGHHERRRRGIAGHRDLVDLELVHRRHGHARAVALEGHPRSAHQALGVVAAGRGIDDRGGAGGQHPRDQHARLHLCAGHRQLVLDARQVRAVHGEGGETALACLEPGAHGPQRLGHPVDRAAADRLVSVEGPGASRLPGEPARQEAHQGARVAHVEQSTGGLEGGVEPNAAHDDAALALLLDPGAQLAPGPRAWIACRPTPGSCGS